MLRIDIQVVGATFRAPVARRTGFGDMGYSHDVRPEGGPYDFSIAQVVQSLREGVVGIAAKQDERNFFETSGLLYVLYHRFERYWCGFIKRVSIDTCTQRWKGDTLDFVLVR